MTEVITTNIWLRLTAAAKRSSTKANVAVAYFGKGAAKLLPLAEGSRLVVDASDHAVKSGQTHPADLKRLYDKGVRIFTYDRLHAKAYVFGSTAFVGSANASNNSANSLVEATVMTTDRRIVSSARTFVLDHCLDELGPKELSRLQKMYRPPKIPGGHSRTSSTRRKGLVQSLPPLRVVQLTNEEPPEETTEIQEAGNLRAEKEKADRRHVVDYFWWQGYCPYKRGDYLLMVTEVDGRALVSPPGRVLHQVHYQLGSSRLTFTYLELANRRRVSRDRLAKELGYGWKKRLHRSGPLRKDLTGELLASWS